MSQKIRVQLPPKTPENKFPGGLMSKTIKTAKINFALRASGGHQNT